MSPRSKVLKLCLCVTIVGIVTGVLLLGSDHKDYTSEEPIAEFEAYEFNHFVEALNETERGALGNNVYAVGGQVETFSEFGFILKGGIACTTVDSTSLGLRAGDVVRIKGRFISFDELFGEVRLDHVVTL